MRLRGILLLGLLVVTQAQSSGPLQTTTDSENLTADEIIMQAVSVVDHLVKKKHGLRYEFFEKTTSEQFDPDGRSKEREEVFAKVYPLAGALHRETLRKNGQPLSPQELKKERHRREEVRRRREQGEKEAYRVRFNRELVNRYHIKLIDEQHIRGRLTYAVRFRPKSNSLPVRHRMDYALNKSHGRIFIDKETFQVARVEFELIEPVKLWWGLLGKLHAVQGIIERGPLADGAWVDRGFDFSMNMRIFFKSVHTRRRTRFLDHRLAEHELSARES